MSGALDTKARQTAEKLLKKFGKVATYINVTDGVYDPAAQTSTQTEVETTITTYLKKPTVGEISVGLVNSESYIALVSSKELGISVKIGDYIKFDGIRYNVLKDMPIYSGELIALHRIEVQK